MKGIYKKKKIWCSNCDMELVDLGSKCDQCGSREKKVTKMRKLNTREILNTIDNE